MPVDRNKLEYFTPPDELEVALARDDRWGIAMKVFCIVIGVLMALILCVTFGMAAQF